MKNWIEETNDEMLKTWVTLSPAMKIVKNTDGRFLWANESFLEWSEYTLSELTRLTWMDITKTGEETDIDSIEMASLSAERPTCSIKKQYIPNGGKPAWGILHIRRWPRDGEVKCYLCTWEPLKNGTATAFALAMEHHEKFEKRLTEMTAEIRTLTSRTDEENWVLGSIRMIKQHPRVAMIFLVVALSIFGLNNVVELLQRTGIIQLPVKVETSNGNHAAVASQIGALVDSRSYLAKSPSGLEVSWSRDFRGTGPLSITDRRAGRGDGPTWTVARPDCRSDVCTGTMSDSASLGREPKPVDPVREF